MTSFFQIIYTGNGTCESLLQELKLISNFNIPIIIHTVSDNTNNYFTNLGFNGYLKKPIKQDETIELLQKLLHK